MKNNIKKVIITGQMLKGGVFSSRWIHSLFSYYIKRTTGLDVFVTTIPTDKNIDKNIDIVFNIEKIYDAFGIDFNFGSQYNKHWLDCWAKIYYNKSYNKKAYDYIYSIFKDSLVISYELEETIQNALEYLEIPFIEINLDPIRFLDDIMLCFKSSNEKVYQRLLDFRVDEEYIKLSANYIKTFYKGYRTNSNECNALFLGQTVSDKTLIDEKTFEIYSILNHKQEFLEAIKGFDRIFYKRHPLVKNDEEIMSYIKSLKNIEIIDDNFYRLLSRKDIKKVISISSGTTVEAKYFGKTVQNLLKEGVPRQTENKVDTKKYVSVFQSFFSLNFWSDILEPYTKVEKFDRIISIANTPNKLRNSRIDTPVYYAYQDPNQTNVYMDVLKDVTNMMPKAFSAFEIEKDDEIIC